MKIQKGVPIPKPVGPRGDVYKMLVKLKVGESFLAKVKARQNVYQSAQYAARQVEGLKVSVRKERCGYRVWRIA